jgi:NAD(P)-dependent dehydrogenase (short-subunit alcohol dehydrogenase family)
MRPKVVLVTGAGRGIGKAIARSLLQAGARVFIAEQDAETAASTAHELSALGEVEALATDVADEAAVRQAVSQCLARFDRLDGLINNAGIADPHFGPIENLDVARWNRVLAVNSGPWTTRNTPWGASAFRMTSRSSRCSSAVHSQASSPARTSWSTAA